MKLFAVSILAIGLAATTPGAMAQDLFARPAAGIDEWVRLCGAVDPKPGYICVVKNGRAVLEPIELGGGVTVPQVLDDIRDQFAKWAA